MKRLQSPAEHEHAHPDKKEKQAELLVTAVHCVGNRLEMGNNSILSKNMNNAVNEEYKNYQINIWCKLGTDEKET